MAHQHSVEITTPIPSVEEVGESLGLNESRRQNIIQIVRKTGPKAGLRISSKKSGSFVARKKTGNKSLNLRKSTKSATARN
jgi:hypothetical protein